MFSSYTSLPLAIHALTCLIAPARAAYTLQDDYSPNNFFNMFDFFTGADPTNGYVNYLNETDAQVLGLVNTNNNQVYMGVDHDTIAQAPGRSSVRLASTATYNHGLIILDLEHMPGGICGTWPAFWLLGPNWPNSGEVDIIENINSASTNQMTLHTDAGCTITNNGLSSGSILGTNCDVDATDNAGCSIATSNTQTYGNAFNAENGGVYATEWTSDGISIFFFPRNSIPSDITAGTPNPANWGLPLAEFSGGCDIDEHFVNQQIVFDTTFCGDWAGAVWSTDPVCSQKASTCVDYVQNNPLDFVDAYWSINSLKVYQDNGAASFSGSPTSSAAATSVPSSTAAGSSTITTTSFITTVTVTATNSLGSESTSTFASTFTTITSGPIVPSTTSSLSNTFFTPSSTFDTTFSTSTYFTSSFYAPSSTFSSTYSTATSFSNTFYTPPSSTPTIDTNTFTPSSTWTATPTLSATWTNAGSWATSWTQPTGASSSWGSWAGGQGGGPGGNGGGPGGNGGGPGGNGGGHWGR